MDCMMMETNVCSSDRDDAAAPQLIRGDVVHFVDSFQTYDYDK